MTHTGTDTYHAADFDYISLQLSLYFTKLQDHAVYTHRYLQYLDALDPKEATTASAYVKTQKFIKLLYIHIQQ